MLELLLSFLLLVISLLALSYSSKIVLESAEKLASYFGFSKLAIWFILISLLTSLPELSIAIFSSATHNNNISLGDLIGSNVVNITLLPGLNVVINPFIPNIEIATAIFSFIFISSGYVVFKLLTSNKLVKKDDLVLFWCTSRISF